MMISFMFTFIALIILIPILFVIPLGLTKLGKGIIMGLSFLLAIVGFAANTMFYIWQTSGILLLLALLFTYLLMNRLSSNLFIESLDTEIEFDEQLIVHTSYVEENPFEVDVEDNLIEQITFPIEIEENMRGNHFENKQPAKENKNEKSDKGSTNVDDEQLEDFFKNRLILFENMEDNLNDEYQYDTTETEITDRRISNDDYIIPEIDFDHNGK